MFEWISTLEWSLCFIQLCELKTNSGVLPIATVPTFIKVIFAFKLTFRQILLSLESFYVVTVGFFKVSLAYYFLRIVIDQRTRQLIYAVLTIFSIYSFGYFFFAIFQCGIPSGSSFWERKIALECASDSVGLGLGYTHAILTASSDLIFLSLVIPIVVKSRLRMREKVIVCLLMAFATL
jgi:hypothetical protein